MTAPNTLGGRRGGDTRGAVNFRLEHIESHLEKLANHTEKFAEFSVRQQTMGSDINRIEGMVTKVTDRIDQSLIQLTGVLLGTSDKPGVIAMLASHNTAIDTHGRNFRLVAQMAIGGILVFMTSAIAIAWAFVRWKLGLPPS